MNSNIAFLIAFTAIINLFACKAFAQEPCAPPAGIDQVISDEQVHFAIFGEVHGSVEAPALFGESVCAAAAEGKSVLVGLEFSESTTDSFHQFMRSSGSPEDVKKLLESSHWLNQAAQFPDGRTSEAMLRLVKRLRELRASGQAISITTFVRPPPGTMETQTPYEQGLSGSLMEANSNGSFDLVMVLVGNIHASKATVNSGTPFEPMAMHLPQDSTMSLTMTSAGGEAWNCRPECGEHPLRQSTEEPEPVVTIGEADRKGYDGTFSVGMASASPPVRE